MKKLFFSLTLSLCALAQAEQKSVTGSVPGYLEACVRAAEDSAYFQKFRSQPEYAPILECGFAGESADYLFQHGSSQIWQKLELLRKLDTIGGPVTNDLPGFGIFSGTTLRYIVIADQITKFFNLPAGAKIAEIGAGFGGQCYIVSQFTPFSTYFIYDLPQVERLIGKVMRTLSVDNVRLMPVNAPLPAEKIDLLISNYAFSECDRQTQLDYFERVVKKADRGYVIFNQINIYDTLSPREFIQLLEENGMNPIQKEEPIATYQGNVLILWDRTAG